MKRQIITEAAFDRYWQMFAPIYNKVITDDLEEKVPELYMELTWTRKSTEALVSWAYRFLRKQDRITWFLLRARIAMLRVLMRLTDFIKVDYRETNKKDKESIAIEVSQIFITLERKELDRIKTKGTPRIKHFQYLESEIDDIIKSLIQFRQTNSVVPREYNTLITKITHFFTQDIPEIQNYTIDNVSDSWEFDIEPDLERIEKEYNEKQSRFIDFDEMDPDDPYPEELKVIIQYPNGSQWLDLNKPYCNLEARAMGHCGNSASYGEDETILSYRTVEKNPKTKKKGWIPHLTFVLDLNTGMLGEMKGRNNQKPDKKYYGVIVDLLRLPIIKGIEGGGYMPENNFSMADLPREVAEQLMEEKPTFADLKFSYEKYGIDDERTKNKLHAKVNDIEATSIEIIPMDGETTIRLFQWRDVDYFARRERNSFPVLDEYVFIMSGLKDMYNHFYYSTLNIISTEDFMEDLPWSIRNDIFNYIVDKIDPDFIKEWEDDNRELTTDGENLYLFLYENEGMDEIKILDEIIPSVAQAIERGVINGIENEMFRKMEDWFTNPMPEAFEEYVPSFVFIKNAEGNFQFESPIYLITEPDTFIKLLTREYEKLKNRDIDWIDLFEFRDIDDNLESFDFDKKFAIEEFKELVSANVNGLELS